MDNFDRLEILQKIIEKQDEKILETMETMKKQDLIIFGSKEMNIKGLIELQKEDQVFKSQLNITLAEIRKDLHNDFTSINERIGKLENYTSTIDTFIKIASNGKFWKFMGWMVLIFALSYATISDEIKTFINKILLK